MTVTEVARVAETVTKVAARVKVALVVAPVETMAKARRPRLTVDTSTQAQVRVTETANADAREALVKPAPKAVVSR